MPHTTRGSAQQHTATITMVSSSLALRSDNGTWLATHDCPHQGVKQSSLVRRKAHAEKNLEREERRNGSANNVCELAFFREYFKMTAPRLKPPYFYYFLFCLFSNKFTQLGFSCISISQAFLPVKTLKSHFFTQKCLTLVHVRSYSSISTLKACRTW